MLNVSCLTGAADKASLHTPGPWHYQENSDVYTHIVRGPANQLIAHLPQDISGSAEANARLIAAAPELLDALNEFVAHSECQCDITTDQICAFCLGSEAIAHAQGREWAR